MHQVESSGPYALIAKAIDLHVAANPHSRMTDSPQVEPLKCFIVEDSGLILRGLIDTLQEMLPLQVLGCAGDEGSACEWLDKSGHDIDLMIVDIFLKSGTGLEVLRHAQTLGLKGHKVVLTNYATPEIRSRCAELDADRVFDKSVQLDELIEYCSELAADQGL
jgi:DNA-binding NarL/FixJ family response regulator